VTKSDIINNTRNIKKIILAKSPAIADIPVKPNTPAMSAITKNKITQLNMLDPSIDKELIKEVVGIIENVKRME
jgi:hypothetical protein